MRIKDILKMRFWKSFWRLFSLNDKKIFKIAISLALVSLLFIFGGWYFRSTEIVPREGGVLKEAYIGQPISLNPILAQSEADSEILGLVFSGLLKSNNEGQIEYDLAEKVEQSEDGKIWAVKLREDVFWHDGEQFSADDVVFTIKSIQNPDSRSLLQKSWQGVEVRKESKFELIFELNSTFTFFEENLKQKIAPEHIFKDIPAANLYLSQYNFEPIGTGPYVFDNFNKSKEGFITNYNFKSNQTYFLGRALIDEIVVKFYKSEPEMIKAFNNRQVDFLNGISANRIEDLKRKFSESAILLPRYFAVFFNSNINPIFQENPVRQALNLAVDRNELADKIFGDRVQLVGGPLLSGMPGYGIENEADFSLAEAGIILEDAGWQDEDGDGVLEKILDGGEEKTDLSFQIVSPEAGPLIETISILKKQWAKIGAKMEIKIVPQSDLQEEYFKSRIYDAIIFGNILNHQPDLFPFWHSSQKFYPGFNLALYEDKKVDQLLEDIRQDRDAVSRAEKLGQVQGIIAEEVPAIFLFNPYYNIVSIPDFHFGDLPSDSLSKFNSSSEKYFNVHKWYLKTDRGFR